ncbi:MAG: hypothetical protein Hyperionvirus9_29 [Hyperionvirus sp.]|uniref:RING-type domain-containing protein n=1 Tax=Hyperionvirus sp. TaxID=2487770 RepID=A0A3G5A956_9VIRU|nr:MAG: hypothetical protein Hyperionvirus9_29 [Hyperionvirus sp.]
MVRIYEMDDIDTPMVRKFIEKAVEAAIESTVVEKGVVQQPLKSADDIVAEVLLEMKHGVKPHLKWHTGDCCSICHDEMKNEYVLQYPCNPMHVYHRNCILTYVLEYKKILCPLCGKIPRAGGDVQA